MTISEDELRAMEQRAAQATKGPWESFVEGRDMDGGSSFIRTGWPDKESPDIYLSLSFWGDSTPRPSETADLDFIAAARQDIPRLVAEVRRLQEQPIAT